MTRPLPSLVASLALLGFCPSADAQANVLYGSDVSLDDLGSIDRGTGAWTTIGSQGPIGSITGLAYDGVHDVLYGCSPSNNGLYTLDKATGLATFVGLTSFDNINGLAYDPNGDTLYCTDLNGNALFAVDVNTGAGTLIATMSGASAVEGLGFDPATNTLYGLDDASDVIVRLDVATGVGTPLPNRIGAAGIWRGLTWDADQGVLWATRVNPGELWRVDPQTGVGVFVGSPTTFVQGLAFEGGPSGPQLAITGSCPGPMTAVVTGATPGGSVAVLYALGRGSFVIPAGFACAGTVTGLSANGVTLAGVVTADPAGMASLAGPVPFFACGRVSVQALDVTTCASTGVADL